MLRGKVVCGVSSGSGHSEGLPPSPGSKVVVWRQRTVISTASSQTTVDYAPSPPVLRSPPVIHTTAYLQQTQQLVVPEIPSSSNSSMEEGSASFQVQPVDLSSNALIWALQKVDNQLNEVEQHPSEVHQAIYDFTNGPVGQATSKGVQTAAKLTMTATIEAAKAAAPVGKWALQQGFKAAVGLVGAAMEQDRKQKRKANGKNSS